MEKKCKFCAMMIPKEASICPHCRKRQGTSLFVWLLTGFFILVGLGMCVNMGSNKGGISSPPSVSVGQRGLLSTNGGELIGVAATEPAFEEFMKARSSGDNDSTVRLLASGLVFTTKNPTKVLVIDVGTFKRKVRILEGDKKGFAGWVPYEWVRPI
jgi:hypothetical protein